MSSFKKQKKLFFITFEPGKIKINSTVDMILKNDHQLFLFRIYHDYNNFLIKEFFKPDKSLYPGNNKAAPKMKQL